ncbi:MAG TPA: D-alanine--D-alanine ligase family protein [Candidatus Saccharicenans sp.]|jgi:D-alanine-D-alanine ligase|nr:D-alanine--D-alanine ligase [Candidatus Saccharicenans sp.]HRD01867.1 D-alanine--D-alanine ligase family protein [Candidatus Saccharicenans sp.]
MRKPLSLCLIFGGRSAEHDVSITSARAIYRHLNKNKYSIRSIYITRKGNWKRVNSPLAPVQELKKGQAFSFLPWSPARQRSELKAEVYFPVLHGPYGEDGTIQGLLEMADVPYVGSHVLASAVGMDKAIFKNLLSHLGLPVTPYLVIYEEDYKKEGSKLIRKINASFDYPLFIKPANMGSSVGISKVKKRTVLSEALKLAFRYDHKILVEKGIAGREIECSVLGNDRPEASLPGEVIPYREFYDYADKYLEGKTRFVIPAVLPADLTEKIRQLALAAFQAIDACGLARVDFFLENKTDVIYINEINTMPGFTEISMYPKLWEASGLNFSQLLDRLIELAFEQHNRKKRCLERK